MHVYARRIRTLYYARDLIGNMCAAFIVRFYSQIFATCSEHVYSEYFQKSSETIARQGEQATAHTRTRERARHAAETARTEKINEAERDRARRSTQTADAILLCIVHIYIANMHSSLTLAPQCTAFA